MSTIPIALRARARILAAQQDQDAPDDSEQGDPSKAQAPPGADEPETVDNAVADETPKMDPDQEDPAGDNEDDLDAFTLEDVIECFLRANSTPSDEQVHALAGLLGLDFEEFEAVIYEKFGEAVKLSLEKRPSEIDEDEAEAEGTDVDEELVEDDEAETDLVADDSLDVQDDIDMFVVAYILFNPTPSDEQIHQLAYVIDLTKEEMEQRIYRMLGSYLNADEDDDEDFDEDGAEIDGEDTDTEDATEGDEDEPDDADEDVNEEDDADAEDAGDIAEPGDDQGDAKGNE